MQTFNTTVRLRYALGRQQDGLAAAAEGLNLRNALRTCCCVFMLLVAVGCNFRAHGRRRFSNAKTARSRCCSSSSVAVIARACESPEVAGGRRRSLSMRWTAVAWWTLAMTAGERITYVRCMMHDIIIVTPVDCSFLLLSCSSSSVCVFHTCQPRQSSQ